MAQNVSTYIKNVGKSFGYAMSDIMKEYNPVISSIATQTKDTAESLYENIKPFVASKPDINEKKFSGTIRNTIDDSIKNVFDDLKSGNLYNKARQNKSDEALAKSIGFDLDFDFDFDDDWGDLDDDDDNDTSAKAIIASNDNSTREIIGAVDQVGYKVADALGTVTVESADYIVKSSKQDNRAMYALNRRGFSQVTQALLSVNNSIASFAQIGEPLSAHMQNSSVFFTRTTETLNRMDQTLQQIAKNTTPAPSATNGNYNLAKGTLGEVLGSDGFNLSSYTDMVKNNLNDYKDMVSMLTDTIKGMKDESSGSYGKNLSLLGMGTKFAMQQMIPKVLKESMKDFNEGIKNFIGANLVKARNKSSNSLIVELIKDAFLPKDGYKPNINTANYNKGQVAWDGIARKALTEVIPEYLSGIYKVLSGKDKVYDFDKGTFKDRKSVKEDAEREKREAARRAGGDFRDDLNSKVDKMKDVTDEYREKMKKEIDDYFYNSFTRNEEFWDIKNFSDSQKKRFGISDDSISIIMDMIDEYKKTPGKRNSANKFLVNRQEARDSFGNNKRREEATGTSNEVYLQNGFSDDIKNNGKEGLTDEYQQPMLFYLAGIYQNTGYLADNIGYISGNSSTINRSNSRTKHGEKVDNIAAPKEDKKTTSTGGEKTITDTIKEYQNSKDESLLDELRENLDEDQIKDIQREKLKNQGKDRASGWKAKMKGFTDKIAPKALKGKFDKPFESAANILDSINIAMTQVIWGKNGDPNDEDGFLGYLMKSTKDTFKKFDDKFDEMFPDLKKKLSKFWDTLFGEKGEDGKRHGGKLGTFRDETREELKNSAAWMGQTVKNFFRSGKPKKSTNEDAMDALREANGVDNAAYGRQVTKTGIVAVSEGEMIIPSELNPFYHGSTNKRDQVRKEKNAITKFYGAFAPGTASVGDRESDNKGLKESIGDYLKNKVNSSKNADREGEGKGHEFIRQGFETLGSGFAEFFQRIGGNNDQKEIEKEKKALNEKAATLLKEAGANKGAIGAGAVIGGGVSLLTGAVVGPLFGAAIGGAVGLAFKSEQTQKILFGDDEGNKGLLPKKVGDFIKDQLPDVGAGTAIGAAGGLFMGSPVLGAVLGGTVGYVKSSENAQNFLFGKKDEKGDRTGGLVSKQLQDKIKKAVPGISAGMIAGAVVGPFGLVGNLMVGAGMGYLATSHNFHKWMFGEDGQGGFVETFKTKIFDNIDIISRNMWNAFKARSRNLFKSLGEKVKDVLTKKARAAADGTGGGLIGKAINLGNKVITGTTNKVGNFLDRKRNKIVGRNLAKGYEVYDWVEDENGKRVKKTLSAAERVARRGSTNNSSINNFDRMIAGANSKEELVELQKQLADLRKPNRALKRSKNEVMTGLYSGLGDLDNKNASKIGKLVSSGKYDKALGMIDKLGLDDSIASKYKEAINSAKSGLEKASDVKGAKDDIIKKLKAQGIDATKAGQLENMQDYISEEIKQRFSDEKVAEQKEEDYKSKITTFLDSIRENTEIIASGKTKKLDSSVSAKDIVDNSKEVPEDSLTLLQQLQQENESVSANSASEKVKEAASSTTVTAFGDVIKTTTNSQGEKVPDLRDAATKESLETTSDMKKGFKAIPVIGTAVGAMQGFFGSIKDKIFGDEKKPGLLGTIKNLLSGEAGGPLSFLLNLLSGTKIGMVGKALKSAVSKITLEGVLANVVGPALFGAAITGKFDSFFSNFGWGKSDKDSDIIYNKETGEQYTKDENGNLIDSNGNIVDQSKVKVGIRGGDTKSFSDSLKINTARGALTGTKSVASVVLGKTALGKGVSGLTSTLGDAASSFVDADTWKLSKLAKKNINSTMKSKISSAATDQVEAIANKAARAQVQSSISDVLSGAVSKLKKLPMLKNVDLDSMAADLSEKISQKVVSSSGKNIMNTLANVAVIAKVAFAVIDFTTGYEDARSTLGITSKPTVGQKILSGILRVVKNCIPVIGTLIPDNVVIDVCCDYIAPALGIDVEELKASREQAQEEVDAYNEENGTNLTVQEYNKQVLKDYTWTERIGNAAKTTVNDAKNKWSNFKTSVKENGLGGTIKNSFKNDIETFKESYSNSGGGILGAAAALNETLTSKLPGVFGEIGSKNSDIAKYANKGELGEMWKVALSDFSSDTSKGEADVSVFSKVIGQIPLVTTKVAFTPLALIKKAGNAIADFFKPVTDGVKYVASIPSIAEKDGEALLKNSESSLQDFLDVSKYEKEDSIFNGLVKGVALTSRIVSYPILLVKNFGAKIKTSFENFIAPIKNSISTLSTNNDTLDGFTKDGDVMGLLQATMEDDPDNPVGGFTKGLFIASKIQHFIPTCISWLGHTIGDGVTELIGKSKSNYETTSKSIKALKEYAEEGDVSSVWKEELKLDTLDPLSGIWKLMFQFSKLFQVVNGALHKFITPILDGISEFKDAIGDTVLWLIDKAKEKLSKTGEAAYKTAQNAVANTSGAGSGMSTFVSQYDSKYKDMSYAGSTVSEKGCAPAVASMVASNYGLKYGMDKAIKDSTSYQNDEGTSAEYFKTALGGQGISTNYIQGSNSAQQITQALANGNQVILLGKDANNTSKDNSPFGPTAHYVVATGLDKNGNLIINDPEADAPRTYSTSILSSANMGISTDSSSGSGGSYDTDIARKTWGYFTSHGYTPAATAGIMGNMYQESGLDPTRHQNGGPAAGIVQWEKYGVDGTRWAQMQAYANQNGYNWDDLDPQLQYVDYETSNTLGAYWKNTSFASADDFKNASDPMKATEGFEKSFERANPDKCNMSRRKEAAEAYYQLYQDSAYTGNYSADDPTGEVSSVSGSSDSTSSSSSNSSGSTGFAGILSAISSAFSKIGNIFTGSSDDSSSSSSSTTGSSTDSSSSSITLGDVPSGKGNSAQKKIVQYAESILGRDQYSRDATLRTQVGQGYSDCSSFAQWAYKNAIGVDPGGNTGAIIDSPLLTTVDEGSTPNTDNLEAGDLMLFRSKDANGRTKNVGHVEIYDGDGNVIGHGSGMGPTKKSLQSYLNTRNSMGAPYIETRRYSEIASLGDNSATNSASTSGTTVGNSTALTNGGMTMSAAGSGLSHGSAGVLLSRKPSFRNKNRLTKSELASQGIRFNKSNNRFSISGSGSDITSQTTEMLNNVKSQVTNSSSGISADLVQKLIESITNVLNMIANNTAPIEKIYQVLAQYTNTSAAESAATTAAVTQAANNDNNSSNEVSDNISNLVGVLGEIARG